MHYPHRSGSRGERVTELQDAVKQCVVRLERYRRHAQRIGEQNTKAGLIEPVIDALGWDVLDPEEVHREYRRRGSDNPVDYALLLLRTPRLFIEAKGIGENLDDPRWANQTISYAAVAGVEWVALTDGAEWRVYNAHAPVPIEQKLFRSVRLEDDLDAAVELLSLLSKDNMRENRIEELWKGFFVDRQVHAELIDLFAAGEPAPELVALLDRRLSKLTREDIRSSLIRARTTFDFPSAGAPPFPTPTSPTAVPPAAPAAPVRPAAPLVRPVPEARRPIATTTDNRRATARMRVSPEERRVRISDMIAVGRLRPGATLHGNYFGQRHTAELLADGTVRYRNQGYSSLSAAGAAVKVAVHGPNVSESRKATDGLDFWHTEDALTGDVVSLKEIRRRTVNDSNR
jgi:hypothetical protein